ncbi:MBL fold metallo-hydrolase [Hymenobacter sp. BT175]|uniref:MBL fold metallo-hydrolase n=1 Tax=Hymenobacter translucens TaxID=2886507 RepID=UPI001D0E0698|nr:MBL fold metallo-hydrolase [Hymenobacter translucens]MCC2548139.1 MBL fold metallo-hydrolase [Hymenobacter translucens]
MPARITFVRNETLKTIRPGYPGNKKFGAQFANGETLFTPRFADVFRWKVLSSNPQKEEKKADAWVPEVVPCAEAFLSTDDMLVWLGHSTFLLRAAGTTLLFDPLLFDSPFLRRRHPLPCRPEDVRGIDFLLISHGHRDHLDEKSVAQVAMRNARMQILAPLGMTPLLNDMAPGIGVQEAGWWQQFDLGPEAAIDIYYLPAMHWHRRGATDLNKVLWGSFLIRANDKLIYFAGDTAWGPHFEQIEQQFGPLDIVLMPIGAYKPPFMMQLSHVNPHEAAKACNVLRAGHLVPMHHGTFDLSDEPASEPLRTLQDVAHGQMLRGDLHTPAVGEIMCWREWE